MTYTPFTLIMNFIESRVSYDFKWPLKIISAA